MSKLKLVTVKVKGIPQWGEIYQTEDGRLLCYDPETYQYQGCIESPGADVEVQVVDVEVEVKERPSGEKDRNESC